MGAFAFVVRRILLGFVLLWVLSLVTFFLFFLPAVGGVPVFRYWVFGVERTDRTPNT